MSGERFRVLVLGGYGTFGARICGVLAEDPSIELIVASRDGRRAGAFAARLAQQTARTVDWIACDALSAGFGDALVAATPRLVIHTAGPFHGQDYAVARACLAAGLHYIDLADSRDFVVGIGTLDHAARERGVLLMSGASTVPALSTAVVDDFRGEFRRLDSIDIGISPGNQTPRGPAIVATILSSCGKPFLQWRGGRWQTSHGWQSLARKDYPPPMGRRWLASVDVPDLALFPGRYHDVRTVVFRAGLEPTVMHLGLWALSWIARCGVVRDWSRHAAPLRAMSLWFARLGSNVGGMHVALAGEDRGGKPLRLTWYLTAGSGHGPQIPATAAVVLARKLARGTLTARGARPCMGLFTLPEFLAELAGLDVRTTVDREPTL